MSVSEDLVYLDHAATSFPKPAPVIAAVTDYLSNRAINPGRASYDRAIQVSNEIDRVREDLGRFFGNPADNPNHTIFTSNATDALNLAISGLCQPGDHVVSSVLEHNSVLRPLHMLAAAGIIEFTLVGCDQLGSIDPDSIAQAITPKTSLVILTHASNVVGAIQPVAEVGALCRKNNIKFLVDAAQTAGALPLNMDSCCIDMVAFTGHKSLQASTGIGGLVIGPEVELKSTRWGGTGVRSSLLTQPDELPYKLEAGTLNGAGIMSLGAGLAWVAAKGMDNLLRHERHLAQQFVLGCGKLSRVTIQGHGTDACLAGGAFAGTTHMPLVSLVVRGLDSSDVGLFLDVEKNVAVRTGLQCAPLAHKALGSYPEGTVRFSFGPENTEQDVEIALCGLAELP